MEYRISSQRVRQILEEGPKWLRLNDGLAECPSGDSSN
jgi:hypothetical protein